MTTLVGYFNHLRLPHLGNIIEKIPLTSSRQFHAAKKHLDSLIFAIIKESKHKIILENNSRSNDPNSRLLKNFPRGDRKHPSDLLSTMLTLDGRRNVNEFNNASSIMISSFLSSSKPNMSPTSSSAPPVVALTVGNVANNKMTATIKTNILQELGAQSFLYCLYKMIINYSSI